MNLFDIWLMWLEKLADLSLGLIPVAICIGVYYGLYRLIKYFIRYHAECQNDFAERREQKRSSQKKINDINRELDEIESSLNAVSSDDKVTPIWGGQPPKKS